jgi:hypothetical protein
MAVSRYRRFQLLQRPSSELHAGAMSAVVNGGIESDLSQFSDSLENLRFSINSSTNRDGAEQGSTSIVRP